MTAIRFGAHLGQQNLDFATLRHTWGALDEAGMDWISAWDHFYEAPPAGGTIGRPRPMAMTSRLSARA